MKRFLLSLLLIGLPLGLYASNFPFNLEIRNATGSTYASTMATIKNPLITVPVEVTNTASLSFNVGTLTVNISPLEDSSATIGSIGAIVAPLPAGANTIGKTVETYGSALTTNLTLSAGVATTVPVLSGRTSITVVVNSSVGELWVCASGTAAVNSSGFLVFRSWDDKLSDAVPVTLIASTALPVCIIQRK